MKRGMNIALFANAGLLVVWTLGLSAQCESNFFLCAETAPLSELLEGTSLELDPPSPNPVRIGGSMEASGSLSDSGTALVGETVVVTFASPAGERHPQILVTDDTGRFSCDYVPSSVGDWSVEACYEGGSSHSPASAPAEAFTAVLAETFLKANLSADSIVAGTSFAVGGALRSRSHLDPDMKILAGHTITLLLNDPWGTPVDSITVTTSQTGQYTFPDVTLPLSGTWHLRVQFAGNGNLSSSSTELLSMRARPSAGYAIIVAGKVFSGAGHDCHTKTTDRAYRKFKKRGFTDEDIFYFRHGSPSDPSVIVDEEPRQEPDGSGGLGIREAIATWARDEMNAANGPLYILFVNHGNTERFYVDPSAAFEDGIIDPWELDEWISQLEMSLVGEAAEENIVFIDGACYSGSFIPTLSHEGKRRILIASADPDEPSFKGPMEADGVRDGEFFVTQLFAALGNGLTVKRSFEEATRAIEAYTSNVSGNGGVSTTLYADDAAQHPLLDDNGDAAGSNDALSTYPGNDGAVSAKVILGYDTATAEAVRVTSVSATAHLSPTDSDPTLEAKVNDSERVAEIWVAIKPPGFDLGKPPSGASEQRELVVAHLDFDSQPETGTFQLNNFDKGGFSGFNTPGRYEILYFVKDAQTESLSVLKRSFVYRNFDATDEPPQGFDLIEPERDSTQNTVLFFDWEDSRDPEDQIVSYTVEISTDSSFTAPEFVIEGIDGSGFMIDESVGLNDLTFYYWRVIASDETGNRTVSSEDGSFHTNDTNGWGNYNVLTEIVRNRNDPSTWPPGSWIEIQPYVGKVYNHYYSALMPLGAYSVDSEAPQFSHEHDDVEVVEESPTTVVQLPEPDPGTASGTVHDSATSSPLRGATVRLEVISGIHFGTEFSTCSGDDGGFHLADLFGAVDYRVTVEKNFYSSYQSTFSLAAGEDKDLTTLAIGFDDVDSDGLPDSFEQVIVDADPDDGIEDVWDVSSDDDFDGDEVANGAECAASTDPTSPDSFLRITAVSRETTGEAAILWASESGVYYEVYYTDDLGAWSKAAGPVAASGTGSTSWTDDGSGTAPPPQEAVKRFYRVDAY